MERITRVARSDGLRRETEQASRGMPAGTIATKRWLATPGAAPKPAPMTTPAELRYHIRSFLRLREEAARAARTAGTVVRENEDVSGPAAPGRVAREGRTS